MSALAVLLQKSCDFMKAGVHGNDTKILFIVNT